MLRRMATVVAVTTALALGAAAPALAQATNFEDHEGNATTCSGGQNPANLDGEILIGGQNDQSDETADIRGTVTDGKFLNVTVLNPDVVITGIVIKGGDNYRIYHSPEPNMRAPLNKGGQIPNISHWFVCGFVDMKTPPPTETETPKPTPTETEKPTEKPTTPPSEKPETPKPVPTSVPAGYGKADNGSASTIGVLAFLTVLAAGAGTLVTRRFLKDN